MPRPSKKNNQPGQPSFSDPNDILTNAPIGVFTSTRDSKLLSANLTLAQMHGYDTPGEIIDSINDIANQLYADSEDRKKLLYQLETHGRVQNFECRLLRRDGSIFWVSINVRRVQDELEKDTYYQGFISEITERKQMQKALQQSQQYYRAIFETSGAGQLIIEEDTTISLANSRFEELAGYSREEIEGRKSWTEFVHPEDLERMKKQHYSRRQDHSAAARQYEFRFVDAQGRIRDIFLCVDLIPHTSQSVASLLDFTKRKQAEEALEKRLVALTQPLDSSEGFGFEEMFNIAELQRLQDKFAQATRVAAIITRPDGTSITAPSNFCRLCTIIRKTKIGLANCIKSDSVLGRMNRNGPVVQPCLSGGLWDAGAAIYVGERHIANWLIGQVRNEEQDEEKIRAYARTIGADEDAAAEAFREVPAMSRQQFEQVADALFTLATQLSKTAYQNVQQARFITERKRAEEEQEKLQSQLFQAQKMESVGILAGGVAHDFNNLLQAMSGNLELLDMKIPDDHPGKNRIHTIQKSMDRASQLIKKLLFFSRKADIQTQVLDLNQQIYEAVKLLERSIPRMISIELILDENAWPVNADSIQVEQVLLNLGTNSADAMPEGGRLIIETTNVELDRDFIRPHTGAKPGKYVLMTVSDTGCGMDKKTREQVFDPFFTTKEVDKGTGLGLASAYGIVKAHEGYILCYSEPGQGTAFKIYWPVAEQGEIRPDEKETDQAVLQDGTETILVVDDDGQVRDLTSEVLEDSGYQALNAENGEQALEIFKKSPQEINLVIMDLNMPGMGGRECARQMLSIDPSVKVLVASGYSANGHGKEASELGVKGFLSKPYQAKELLVSIRNLLDEDQG